MNEGDTVGDFEVVETPGNAVGHVSYWGIKDEGGDSAPVAVEFDLHREE